MSRISSALSGGVERTARIAVEKNAPDFGALGNQQVNAGYDPYFAFTELEKIQSKSVLYDVIDRLKLNEEWAGKDGSGKKLTTAETYDLLKKKLSLSQTPNTGLIDIR